VDVPRDEFDPFEQMHFNCFHYAFEHWADPDEECTLEGCGSEVPVPRPDPGTRH
jgi:hypothetical protein